MQGCCHIIQKRTIKDNQNMRQTKHGMLSDEPTRSKRSDTQTGFWALWCEIPVTLQACIHQSSQSKQFNESTCQVHDNWEITKMCICHSQLSVDMASVNHHTRVAWSNFWGKSTDKWNCSEHCHCTITVALVKFSTVWAIGTQELWCCMWCHPSPKCHGHWMLSNSKHCCKTRHALWFSCKIIDVFEWTFDFAPESHWFKRQMQCGCPLALESQKWMITVWAEIPTELLWTCQCSRHSWAPKLPLDAFCKVFPHRQLEMPPCFTIPINGMVRHWAACATKSQKALSFCWMILDSLAFGCEWAHGTLVPSVQQCMAWNLHQTSQQRASNGKDDHHFRFCQSMTKDVRRGEWRLSGWSKCWHQVPPKPDFYESQVLISLGLVVAHKLGTITLPSFVGVHSNGRQMGGRRSLMWAANWAMPHPAAGMMGMQDPSKKSGEVSWCFSDMTMSDFGFGL